MPAPSSMPHPGPTAGTGSDATARAAHLPEHRSSRASSAEAVEMEPDLQALGSDWGGRVAVIAGGGGVVGATLARTLVSKGWEVIGLARKRVDIPGVRWVGVDLIDAQDCHSKLSALTEATHIFCAARYNFAEGGREPLEENLAIVRNVVETLDSAAPGLRHIHMVQGMKYYGSHAGPFMTPAKESHPRCPV